MSQQVLFLILNETQWTAQPTLKCESKKRYLSSFFLIYAMYVGK